MLLRIRNEFPYSVVKALMRNQCRESVGFHLESLCGFGSDFVCELQIIINIALHKDMLRTGDGDVLLALRFTLVT